MVEMTESAALSKEAALRGILSGYDGLVLAFSGGVDSTYLADVAHEVLGDRLRLFVADTPSFPRSELAEATDLATARGWRLAVRKTGEFEEEDFLRNDARRCYWCKTFLFREMQRYAREHGIRVLAYGENAGDLADPTRLGSIAAEECRAVAPLRDAGLTKDEIRVLSARRGLPTANKAAFACLASRIPKGSRLTLDALARIETVEETFKRLGFRQYRARCHGDICRIEVLPEEMDKCLDPEVRTAIVDEALRAGFRHVTLDLLGYRVGGADRAIPTFSPDSETVRRTKRFPGLPEE